MTEDRKQWILNKLKESKQPISATAFAKELSVSRQVIVNDVALMRASGEKITATPRGYIWEQESFSGYIIACKHGKDGMRKELMTIVECGCGIIDVIVNHDVYGQLSGNLCIYTKKDVDDFIEKINSATTQPLCSITNDYHFHTLYCPTKEHFERVKIALEGIVAL